MAGGMRGLIGLAVMLVLALAMLGSAAMAGQDAPSTRHPSESWGPLNSLHLTDVSGKGSGDASFRRRDELGSELRTHAQAFEDGFLGGAGRGGVTNDPDFARPIGKLGFKTA